MELFKFNEHEVLTSYLTTQGQRNLKTDIASMDIPTFGLKEDGKAVSFVKDNDPTLTQEDLSDQFLIFQLSSKKNLPTILESSQNEPILEGSSENPDVLMNMEMLSFNMGQNENIDKNARATMRINIGKDDSSTDKNFDTAFWSIAAGLNLYNQAKKGPSDPQDLKSDFRKAFGNRPIEIPGGLSKISFEVVKHREPEWWQRIFSFLESNVGKTLISTVGFPAIGTNAINMLNDFLNNLDKSEPEILFKSSFLRLALTKQARQDFNIGSELMNMGCLNPGFCVLARGKDFDDIANSNATYYPTYGKLVPMNVSAADLLKNNYDDPFKDITYSVFRVGMKATKLDPNFNFGK